MVAVYEREERFSPDVAAEAEPAMSGVSWASVTAGAAANLAVTILVLSLGVGLGLSVISPWGGSVAPTTFKIGTGLYFIVVTMISASIGGYLAGRLRTKWTGVHSDEVYFRDTAHGFLSWAVAAVAGVLLLSAPAALIAGGMSSQTRATASASDKYADALLRTGKAPDAAAPQARDEVARIVARSLSNGGTISPFDRESLQTLVVDRTGLSPADADKRVSEVATQMTADLDNARRISAQIALWLAASMVIGAFCASLAATEGGGLRDSMLRETTQRPR